MVFLDTIFLIGVVLGLLCWFIKWKFTYWQRNEITFLPPKFPLGFITIPRSKQQFSLRLASVYEKYKDQGPFVGLYFFVKPVILLTDVDMIRNVLIKDFSMFASRGIFVNEKVDPLSAHLFNLDYERWRPLRAKLTPTFTSGKMKYMFPTVVKVGEEFVNCLGEMIKTDNEVEMNDLLGMYTVHGYTITMYFTLFTYTSFIQTYSFIFKYSDDIINESDNTLFHTFIQTY